MTTVVISDDPALATGQSVVGTWPDELATLATDADAPLELDIAAEADAGFAPEATGPSFTDLVDRDVVHSTQLVVFFESRFWSATVADVGRGAEEAFAAVERAAPDALVVVVAPWDSAAGSPAPSSEVRAAVSEAVAGAEVTVTYVDPVTEGWPTRAEPRQVAALLFPHVAPLAQALTRSGAFD